MKFQWAYSEDNFDCYPFTYIEIEEPDEYYKHILVRLKAWSDLKSIGQEENELLFSGTFKWDGCCHIYLGEPTGSEELGGYSHLCGVSSFEEHFTLLRCCYKLAQEIMERHGQTYFNDSAPEEKWTAFESQHFGFVRSVEE